MAVKYSDRLLGTPALRFHLTRYWTGHELTGHK
jgi:hypothetical protein